MGVPGADPKRFAISSASPAFVTDPDGVRACDDGRMRWRRAKDAFPTW
jgi:hypothetical protein